MGEVRVVGIRVEQPQNQPVLLLREADGDRYLPIWIGQSEAAAIALRVGVPIYVEEAVLAQAGLLIPDENDEEPNTAVREDEVEKFKEFLDSVSPDDFKAT